MPITARLLLCLAAFTWLSSSPAQTADGTAASLVERVAPIYPRPARLTQTEGWVLVGYSVTEAGRTDDIHVLDASIEDVFDQAAISAIRQYRYEPATFLGEAVSQGGLSQRIFFILSSQKWEVGKAFETGYAEANRALNEDRPEDAERRVKQLGASPRKWLAEVYYMSLLRLRLAQARGDSAAALRHIDQAVLVAREKAPRNVLTGTLRQAVQVQAQASEYALALDTLAQLRAAGGGLADDDPMVEVERYLRSVIAGDQPIERSVAIRVCETCWPTVTTWDGKLNRNQFQVDQVDGEVSDVEVSCGMHTVSFDYEPGRVWLIDREWGDCALRVYGAAGTTFRLLEPPRGAGAG